MSETSSSSDDSDDMCDIGQLLFLKLATYIVKASSSQSSLDHSSEELSTGTSLVKANTPMQGSGSTGKRSRKEGTSRKRKKKATETVQNTEFQTLVANMKCQDEEKRSYYAVKKEYYEVKKNGKLVDPTCEQSVKALVDLDIEESHPDVFYFGVELFNDSSRRQMFLALPQSARFSYLERLFNKSGGHAPLG
ncbi:hypothetical protein HS088_TW22G00067 [Tripterygium wilfordii]|uniref:Uncharacterized protein n=1 Tax=Tripterygium wilfordii TaxID=458696 RepID=A0A7J7BWW7_TRIWF|nr:uncharacterized protein LOC119992192 [Tripterygium wilfordii]KAF5726389.1 hypothetical protein HS088_TW22G00067 [Tripterygium wilfordii]